MSRSPGPLALAIAGLAFAYVLLSSLLAFQVWTSGLSPAPDNALAIWQSFAYAGCALATLVWLARAIRRVEQAGAVDLSAGPVMAVVWWFVPLAQLVMPPKVMGELRRASIRPADWQAVDGSALVAFWWAGWIVSNLAGIIVWRAEASPELDMAEVLPTLHLVSSAVGALAALLFLVLVLSIDRRLQAFPSATPGRAPRPA